MAAALPESDARPRAVLAVDDDANNLRLLERIVAEHLPECQLVTVTSANEGLAELQRADFDGALIDVQMPEMDGIEMCRQIKSDERIAHLPVFLVTGHQADPALKAQGLQAGADDFIAKPIGAMELVAKIQVMLRIKSSEDRLRQSNALLEQRALALARKEEYYRSLLFSLHEDILVIDRDYRIVDLNAASLRTSGYTREQAIGRYCYELSHDRSEPCPVTPQGCRLAEVFETGQPASCQHEHQGPDGNHGHVDILLSPLRNERGEITHVIEAVRDVTDVVMAQQQARESERLAETILISISDAVFLTDDSGDFVYICPNVHVIFGSLPRGGERA